MRKNFKKYLAVLMAAALCLTAMVGMVAQAEGEFAYVQVTDAAKILDGGEFVIVAKHGDKYYAMNTTLVHAKKMDVKEVSVADGKVTADVMPVLNLDPMGEGVSLSYSLYDATNYIQYDTSTDFVKPNKGAVASEWKIEAKENGLFRISLPVENDTVVLCFRENIENGNLKYLPAKMTDINKSDNIFVLDLMFFEKTDVSEIPEVPEIDDTADINAAPLYAVLALGIAVVAFASKKRFAR